MSNAVLQTFNSILSVKIIDRESEKKARAIFRSYLNAGVFYNCIFDDNIWNATDDYSKRTLRFMPDKFLYKRFYENYLGISYDDFLRAFKTYTVLLLGDLVLNTIQTFVYEVERIVATDPADLPDSDTLFGITMPQWHSEFFSMLPALGGIEENIQSFMGIMDSASAVKYSDGQARELASFESYFKFNDIVEEYWGSEISKDERLFYYPLYLWWKVTAILPLRPREFLVTPRNCLRQADDGYYLSIRRDRLKGTNRFVTYKLETDYTINEYKIPDKLAKEIQDYLKFTEGFDATDIDTLFVTDYHYHKWKQKKHSNSRFFTYINMNTVLRYFFEEIISQRYGYKVIMERNEQTTHLKDDEIQYIYLGDTRHLAMINILAEGGTPVIAMALAGHSDIDISMHYAANLTKLIECRVYRQYRKTLTGDTNYQLSWKPKYTLDASNYVFLSDKSRCYSQRFYSGDFTDCEKVIGDNGEIGACEKCQFNRRAETRGFFSNDSNEYYKKIIEQDCKKLSDVIALVRKEKGEPEDIWQAMMRLNSSTMTYEQFCRERMMTDHGKKKGRKP